MPRICHLDFETRSDVDLRAAGLYNYAKAWNTDIICAAYAFDDGPVKFWLPSQGDFPKEIFIHIESGGEVHAHNAPFERELCNNVGTRKYGMPYIYDEQLVCTMAMAYAMGLPGTLGGAAAALGVENQKDNAGYRLMLQMCQPRALVGGKIIWWDAPEMIQRLVQYCCQDVRVEREISKRMLRLSNYERKVWQLDQKINDRGIKIDIPAVKAALKLVAVEKQRLIKEIQDASENTIASPSAIAQIKAFLALYGFDDVESIAKVEAAELLSRANFPEPCRKVMEIRAEAGKTSTAKLDAMLEGSSQGDNRFRGAFQYSGANTRRWAGRRVQLQNLPRTKISPALVDDILKEMPSLTGDKMRLFYGPPLDVLSNCLRGCLIADKGKEFLCCDFSAIEARVIAWLAGQTNVLEIFRKGGDIYVAAAASIFGKSESSVTQNERQIGKVAVLALGYQGGVGALQKMAKAYGVKLEPAFKSLWSRATSDQKDFVELRYEQSKGDYSDISKEEFIASDLTKVFWRLANPRIVEFWGQLEHAAINAVKVAGAYRVLGSPHPPVVFKTAGSFLWARLPSNGTLCFPYPQVKVEETKWKTHKETLSYMSEDQNKKWVRFKTYGGSLAENVTQSFARDLLADAMLRLDSRGFEIVAHVHDEVVVEAPIGEKSVKDMANIMSENPIWAGGLPIEAAGWTDKRYRKS